MRTFSSKHFTVWFKAVSSFITARPEAPAPTTKQDFLPSAAATTSMRGCFLNMVG